LNVASVEALARLDEVQIVLPQLSLLNRFFLSLLVSKLHEASAYGQANCLPMLVYTYATEVFPVTIIDLGMCIPKPLLHLFPICEFKVVEKEGLGVGTVSGRAELDLDFKGNYDRTVKGVGQSLGK
jgi:hypothetical protein